MKRLITIYGLIAAGVVALLVAASSALAADPLSPWLACAAGSPVRERVLS